MKFCVLILLLAVLIVLCGCPQPGPSQEYVAEQLEQANYCSVKDDCVKTNCVFPFGCALVNQAEVERINALLSDFVGSQHLSETLFVGIPGVVQCTHGKCVEKIPEAVGDECENDAQCSAVGCSSGFSFCVGSKCACPRIQTDESLVESLFENFMQAELDCDIETANSMITKESLEIVRFTCGNMAGEAQCYVGRAHKVIVKEDTAILYLTPYSRSIENPFFFKKENGEWKVDFYKMANGLVMAGSGCDSGWGWRNIETWQEFCSFFPENTCPDEGIFE